MSRIVRYSTNAALYITLYCLLLLLIEPPTFNRQQADAFVGWTIDWKLGNPEDVLIALLIQRHALVALAAFLLIKFLIKKHRGH